jgi:hypothetical protein
MEPMLERFGFKRHGEKWVRHLPWSVGLHTLHDPRGVSIKSAGVTVMNWYEWDTPLSRLKNPTGTPKNPAEQPTMRFFAPAPGQTGTVAVTVEAPHDILDAQIRCMGTIVEAGHQARVDVKIDVGFGGPALLYSITDGAADGFAEITSTVRGRRKFTVVGTLTASKEKYPYARFLTSIPTSRETFWVRGTVLEPAPQVDKLWQSARP